MDWFEIPDEGVFVHSIVRMVELISGEFGCRSRNRFRTFQMNQHRRSIFQLKQDEWHLKRSLSLTENHRGLADVEIGIEYWEWKQSSAN